MAIDTETRRRSVSGYTGTLVYPVADGTIDVNDREHIAYLYAGITALLPSELLIPTYYEVKAIFRQTQEYKAKVRKTQERNTPFRITQERKIRF